MLVGGCSVKDTRLEFNAVRPISSVIVLVDFDDVKAMKLGALTDYISMVGLAQVDLDGDWGDVPTVLRLFSNSADVAAQRMSAWDRSFLKALYSTPQKSRFQRSEIARSMVRDFVKEQEAGQRRVAIHSFSLRTRRTGALGGAEAHQLPRVLRPTCSLARRWLLQSSSGYLGWCAT